MDDIDTLNNTRFELLSAYIDHEVSVDERKQVEQWLAEDPQFYTLYQRLLVLQRSCQSLPTPAAAAVDQTAERVLARIEARRRLPLWGTLVAAAIAATVGAISDPFRSPQFAEQDQPQDVVASVEQPTSKQSDPLANAPLPNAVDPAGLMIALEQPPVELAAASGPVNDSQAVDPSGLMISVEQPPVELSPMLEVADPGINQSP
jgi:hypothetical protein